MAGKRGRYKSNLRGYDAYSALYDAAKIKMEKKGYHMKSEKLTKLSYETLYEAYRNTRKYEVEQGKRKTLGDINRAIVTRATYTYTKKQAAGYKSYLSKKGIKEKINNIRAGAINFEEIEEARRELENEGYNSSAIRKRISQEFFGSE